MPLTPNLKPQHDRQCAGQQELDARAHDDPEAGRYAAAEMSSAEHELVEEVQHRLRYSERSGSFCPLGRVLDVFWHALLVGEGGW